MYGKNIICAVHELYELYESTELESMLDQQTES